MTETSRPWVGIVTGDAGPYSAEQWQEMEKYSKGIYDPNTGGGPLIGSGTPPDNGLTVQAQSPAAAGVTVTIGSAVVEGTYYRNDANLNLTVNPNVSGSTRIDTVVLRQDVAAQTVRLAVLEGTPGTGTPPTLTQDATTWETPLADITLTNGFVTIANTDIMMYMRFVNTADGIYIVNVRNDSGGELVTGDVVVWTITVGVPAFSVTTTDSTLSGSSNYFAHPSVAGVWVGRTPDGEYGKLLWRGVGYVRCTSTIQNLIHLITSQTAKVATPTRSGQRPFAFATAIESANFGAGNGLVKCWVNGTIPDYQLFANASNIGDSAATPYQFGANYLDSGANETTTSASFGNVTNATLQFWSNGPIMVGFSGVCFHSLANNYIAFDLEIAGVRLGLALGFSDGLVLVRPPIAGANGATAFSWQGIISPGPDYPSGASFPGLITGLTAAPTIQLVWKTQAATATILKGAGVAGSDVGVHLWMYALPMGPS